MRTFHQPDLAHFRQPDEPASVGDTSILFGVLLCCFAFGMTFMAAVCGVPG